MKITNNPPRNTWSELTLRPQLNTEQLNEFVASVFQRVEAMGDAAIRGYTREFDNVLIDAPRISSEQLSQSAREISTELKNAIQLAANNIRTFHEQQTIIPQVVETMPGIKCWRESRAIESVGLYIPGGSAPLFSTVLMLGIPATIAGCTRIVLCSPPNSKGTIHPAILYAASVIGINEIYAIGGVQAIAAMSTGTDIIPKVDKLFGPGNQYVTAAKEFAQRKGVAIDMPAGPSELLIIADETSNPEFVAADLLSQAEHGTDSQVILVTNSEQILNEVKTELSLQVEKLPRKEIAKQALESSRLISFDSLQTCLDFSNAYGPEHLIIATKNARDLSQNITCAGSAFLGNYSCESLGDYASGTNHTLPTNGYARNYSGVSVDTFVKKITFQEISADGIREIGPAVECMADAEELFAHKNAVTLRLKTLES